MRKNYFAKLMNYMKNAALSLQIPKRLDLYIVFKVHESCIKFSASKFWRFFDKLC
jgi:hypothetical protein